MQTPKNPHKGLTERKKKAKETGSGKTGRTRVGGVASGLAP